MTRWLLLASLAFALPASAAGTGFKARGFMLPDGAVRVDDDRYRLQQTWDETMRFYRLAYPAAKFPRHTLRSQSLVRAVHIANPGGDDWEGANVYEISRGEVRVFVLAAQKREGKPPKGRTLTPPKRGATQRVP